MLFERNTGGDRRKNRQYALYEIAYTVVDFSAAILFIVGSVMFFYEAWQHTGTWLFVIGSVCFALKPTIRLVREVHLAAIGDYDDVAERQYR